MKRIILHLDMDAFFAQTEERENPQFKGKPVVVGADPKGGFGRGVVSTCNYEARKYGIHSALPISQAFKLCPGAIFLPVNMALYKNASGKIMEIIKKYSPQWEIVSLDEAYLDLSHLRSYKKAKSLAKKLKKEILKKEKLTLTVGIGPNKLIAKIACQKVKPDGLLIITQAKVKSFLKSLDVQDLPGIGPKTAKKLGEFGVSTIGGLRKLTKIKLKSRFGKLGEIIYERARGIDEKPVIAENIVKSIGKEHTFEKDTRDSKIIFATFEKILKNVYQEIVENNFSFKTITVICRFSGFETHTRSKTIEQASNDFKVLKKIAKRQLLEFLVQNPKPIRLIGLRLKIC